MKTRVGIFGGTFNPPHIGHIRSAEQFADQMKLDKLIIMPSFIPPHKVYDINVSCEDRFEMCKLAFTDIAIAEVSDLEIQRGGKSYTYLTLEEMSSENIDLFFLCGTDMILSMDTWRNPEIIFELCSVCYARRESDPEIEAVISQKCEEYTRKFGAKIYKIDLDTIDISSSEIRNNEINNTYLTPAVREYIAKRGLYR